MNHTPETSNSAFQPSLPDDAMLTAFALGELSGDDAAQVARRIEGDTSLRAEVDSIRATADILRQGFRSEPAQMLTASQRARVMNADGKAPSLRLARSADDREVVVTRTRWNSRTRWISSGLAAAAMLALTATAALLIFNGRVDTGDVAIGRSNSGESAPASGVAADSSATRIDARREEDARGRGTINEHLGIKDKQEDRGLRSATGPEPAATSDLLALNAESAAAPPRLAPPPAPPPPSRSAGEASTPLQQPSSRSRESTAPMGGGAGAAGDTGVVGGRTGEPVRERDRAQTSEAPLQSGNEAPADSHEPATTRQAASGPETDHAREPTLKELEPENRTRDADDANASARGGLRNPSRQLSEAEASSPRIYSEDEITHMTQDEVRRLVHARSRAREDIDARTAAQLKREFGHLVSRLRALERADAEEYSRIHDNPFIKPVGEDALSTFALDVDTASYSNVRRFLNEGRLPPADAVRIEEMINYFKFDYPVPTVADGEEPAPFSANLELAPAPWNPEHRLLRVGIRGKDVRMDMRPATSLVFLIDVSGSMNQPNKLPLVKQALNMLVEQLNGDDRLAIVTYAGNAGLVLDSCFVNADNRVKIDAAIENMQPGGSTNGAGGINLAYDVARQHFIKGGLNRIILCTDGDFNVGVSGDDALVQLIEEQRKSDVFLTILGFGTGNFKDSKMERLSNAGDGNFAYIDSVTEAKKVLVEQAGGTLVTIAKDVKFQVEFNPAKVGAYRLIGYENRLLAAEDFNNDLKDAGEIGSGHTMTALYELVPIGAEATVLAKKHSQPEIDELEYQKPVAGSSTTVDSENLLTVKIRYKQPDGDASHLLRFPLKDQPVGDDKPTDDFRFASAVAEFGMLLRRSQYVAGGTFDHVIAEAEGSMGEDPEGYRAEFIELVKKARALDADAQRAPVTNP